MYAIIHSAGSLDVGDLSRMSAFFVAFRTLLRKTVRLDPPVPVVLRAVPTPLKGQPAVQGLLPGIMMYFVTVLRW